MLAHLKRRPPDVQDTMAIWGRHKKRVLYGQAQCKGGITKKEQKKQYVRAHFRLSGEDNINCGLIIHIRIVGKAAKLSSLEVSSPS